MEVIEPFTCSVIIKAPAAKMWQVLTETEYIKQWMSEEEIEISASWQTGSEVIIKGTNHWVYFENNGTVLESVPNSILRYTHLSSLSNLPALPKHFTEQEFRLQQTGMQTELKLKLSNFPTESIYKHLAFYWPPTLNIIKALAEKETPA